MMPTTNDIERPRNGMAAEAPATPNVAVVASIDANQATEDSELGDIRANTGPEPIPRARQIVNPHDMQEPGHDHGFWKVARAFWIWIYCAVV